MTPIALLPPESARRTIDGPEGPIHFLDIGEGEPVLLLPAFGPQPGVTSWLIYREVIARLAPTRRCIVVDLALQHPERVERLVIGACHASTGGDPYLITPFPSEVWNLWTESQADPADAGKLARLMRGLLFDAATVTDELVDALMAMRTAHPDHWQASRDSVSVDHSNVTALHRLSVPVLVIHGRFDRMVPFEQALMIMSYVPQADVVVLNACGHWPPFERPASFAAHVLDFLGGGA